MRNLRLVHSLRVGDASELSAATHLSVDYDTGWAYCATTEGVVVLDPNTQQVISQVDLVSDGYLTPDVSIVGLQHLPDQMAVSIATSRGDMLLWNPATFEVECAGSVDSGITAMGWSPDHELVVIATGQSTLVMMTREFDPITELPLEPSEFGEAENINVGWGKKETQFHGSEGKQAAQKKQEAVKQAFDWDDRSVRISWRGDGQMFTVSNIDSTTGATLILASPSVSNIDSTTAARRVRVWTRECVLHSSSEAVDGLEQALAWSPSGTLIASSQRRPNKHDIIFFEQNGLRHGEFTLPYGVKQVKVHELMWNLESSVLVTWCEDLPQGDDTDSTHKSYVDLWTVNNYHWYQKQHLEFRGEDAVSALCWDPEQAYRLHVLCVSGQYLQYTWAWGTDVSRGQDQEDLTVVAVIDGDKLLLTPFRQMVVPPPMCAYYLQLPEPVNQVVFAPPPDSNRLAVVLASGRVLVYQHTQGEGTSDDSVKVAAAGGNGFVVRCGLPQRQAAYSISHDAPVTYPCQWYHVTWLPGDVFAYSTLNIMGSQSTLGLLHIQDDKLQAGSSAELEGYQYGCAVHPGTGHMILQLTDGSLLTYNHEENLVEAFMKNGRPVKFPLPCTQMALDVMDGEDVALGLTERFRFYVNEQEVANNVTSFCLHSEFLLLTTHSHTCRCIHRNTPLKDLPTLSAERAHPFDETVRRVERGSRIVCAVAMDTKLMLQMPRGNLETVHPRALVLSSVRRMLDNLDYMAAFTTVRKHRLNMNLLCDHNLDVFLENVTSFIEQVDSVTNINLFLTDLQAEDVTRTMYTGAYSAQTSRSAVTSKVDVVCDAMCRALESKDADRYLLSILTSYVRKTTPQLEVALNRIKDLRARSAQPCHVSAEEALKYLLFLVDVNELYDVALGTYDFELVVMVAEKSQKDPKEYLPFLNELRKMEENYQRYSIDRHLKRHLRALEHISQCGADHFPECLTLVNEQRLYARALQLYTRGSTEYQAIAEAYASYLSEKRHHQEAGLVLMKAGQLEGALKEFETSLDWRQAICVCGMLGVSEDKLQELARRMAESLKTSRRHLEASCLLEQYGQDVEEAIVTLIEGSEWLEALRLMYRYKRLDFLETNLKPSVVEAAESMVELLDAARLDYERYTKRLAVVRELKEQARLELMEGGGGGADSDLFSDTSSATGESVVSATSRATSRFTTDTQHSNMSGRSGKSRRKAERRKWSLKEGSRNEDLALIEALHQAAGQAEERKKDVSSLLSILVQLDYEDQAARLQHSLTSLLTTVTAAIPQIWDPEQEDLGGGVLLAPLGPESTANSIAQAMQSGRGGARQDVQLDGHLRFPPALTSDTRWQLHMLCQNET